MRFILALSCPDRSGIVASVTSYLARAKLNIEESHQFGDTQSGQFFMRVALAGTSISLVKLQQGFVPIAKKFHMQAQFHKATKQLRTAILLSKFDHCLVDILHRIRTQRLDMDVRFIASNHTIASPLARQHKIPFHHLPITASTKPQAEAQLARWLRQHNIELIVLARYMQILSPSFVAPWRGRIINIHHSFLPSFQGAQPYSQAHKRGVKMIGATAHYVTAKLDDGPIIEQAVVPVRHDMTIRDMTQLGWEIEQRVLARALRWHCAHRVLLNDNKTVIFA